MDEELPAGLLVRCGDLANPRQRSGQPTREPSTQTTRSHRESGGRTADGADRLPTRSGEDEHGDQRRTRPHSWADGHHLHGNHLWKKHIFCYAVLKLAQRPPRGARTTGQAAILQDTSEVTAFRALQGRVPCAKTTPSMSLTQNSMV